MGELYYPRPMTSMSQNSPSLNIFFEWPLYYVYSGQSNFEFKNLGEFVTEFENILGYESEAQIGLIDEKNQRSKILCYCPFNSVISNGGKWKLINLHTRYRWNTVNLNRAKKNFQRI
jgi:hypothetical protein